MTDGKREARYSLPVGASIFVNDGTSTSWRCYRKNSSQTAKTRISRVVCRVVELFEARKPKDVAIMVDRDGTVSFGADSKEAKVIIKGEDGELPST